MQLRYSSNVNDVIILVFILKRHLETVHVKTFTLNALILSCKSPFENKKTKLSLYKPVTKRNSHHSTDLIIQSSERTELNYCSYSLDENHTDPSTLTARHTNPFSGFN